MPPEESPPQILLPPKKRCVVCFEWKEPEEFASKGGGHRESKCRVCIRDGMHGYNRALADMEEAKQQAISGFVQDLRRNISTTPHITELCGEMIKRFGNLEAFTIEWHTQIRAAIDKNPGSKTVLDSMFSIVKLITLATEHRESMPVTSDMTADEIERELNQRLSNLVPAPPKLLTDETDEQRTA